MGDEQGVVIGLREIYDKMQEIGSDVKELKTETNTKVASLEQRVKKLEENATWLWRTTIGAIISAIVALYLKK